MTDPEAIRNRQYVALLRNQLAAYAVVREDLEFTAKVPGLPARYVEDVRVARDVCTSMIEKTVEEIAIRTGANEEPIH